MSTNSHSETDLGKDSVVWCRCTKSKFFWGGIASSALVIFFITNAIINFITITFPNENYFIFTLWYIMAFGIVALTSFSGYYTINSYCKKESDLGKPELVVGFGLMIIAVSVLIISANYIDEDWIMRSNNAEHGCNSIGYDCKPTKYIPAPIEEYETINDPIKLEKRIQQYKTTIENMIIQAPKQEKLTVSSLSESCRVHVTYNPDTNDRWIFYTNHCIKELDKIWDSFEQLRSKEDFKFMTSD